MDNIIILLAVLFGFYLGRFGDVNEKIEIIGKELKVKIKKKKKKEDKSSLVVATDEVALERAEARKELDKAETIDVKEVVKNG